LDNIEYSTNEGKAKLFGQIFKSTFSGSNDPRFNDKFKKDVDNALLNINFKENGLNHKDLINMDDLNV
jgi:hypothetical protein